MSCFRDNVAGSHKLKALSKGVEPNARALT
jgi:hypothetical protein